MFMEKIVECVPNFSEGRDKAVIEAIAASIKSVEGVRLLDVDSGVDFNRTVYTFVGEPEPVLEAACRCARVGVALIDMRKHRGEHARMGALDVMPFIPIKGVTMEDCIQLSKRFGEWMAKELGVPVFLYANSATRPDRVRLPDIRKGEYEALEKKFKDPSFKPDYGEPVFVPKSGATATGAREFLIAYNINLNTNDKSIASEISGKIRTSGYVKKDEKGNPVIGADGQPVKIPGRFKGVQAGGMMYNENIAQVSMNLLNYREVNLHDVFEAVKEEAEKLGVKVTGSEIVGVVPKEALVLAGKFYAKKEKLVIKNDDELVSLAIDKLGLSQLYQFKPEEKVIEYMIEETGPLASMSVKSFLSELASSSPAPGGGSVAALCGALGAALSSMVCNLTIGKEKYESVQYEIKKVLRESDQLRKHLIKLIDKDTESFNEVMKALKMPKETDEQKEKRKEALQKAYKNAAMIPFETAKNCEKLLDLAMVVAEKGNQNSITDAAISAYMANVGVQSAVLNVKINFGSIKDGYFVEKMRKELDKIEKNSNSKTDKIVKIVAGKM
ncbi:MAG: glutamate formimidoyltransferase [Candidatus Thermoplasmatota archaeon]|jgi:glutamate formiminotransferase/formiminotetrahydrofolate cyclodeaminase|nr:glutamate formimidoyltransferase [Candidatus Thermoplasmatota archaeon]